MVGAHEHYREYIKPHSCRTSSKCTYVMFEVYIIDMISQESVF